MSLLVRDVVCDKWFEIIVLVLLFMFFLLFFGRLPAAY